MVNADLCPEFSPFDEVTIHQSKAPGLPGSTLLNGRTATADFASSLLFVRGQRIDHWIDLALAAAQVSARISLMARSPPNDAP
jgi:hypothetical protein